MRLHAGCEMTLEVAEPLHLVLMLRPRSGYGQWIAEERYQIMPLVPVVEYIDGFGNVCQRMEAPVGRFTIATHVAAETSPTIDVNPGAPRNPVGSLPDNVLQFTLPSRFCQSDMLSDLALQVTAGCLPGYDEANAICNWIHANFEYRYGTSNASTSALDTVASKVGVCRDFAHLGISLCRNLDIPARMVVGYLHELKPMDLHAWFEAFINGRWYTFDATQDAPRGGRIAIAYGRDAADVAMVTQFGEATLAEMRVWVNQEGN
jgi:transglutaminase-like putative cysteine protease